MVKFVHIHLLLVGEYSDMEGEAGTQVDDSHAERQGDRKEQESRGREERGNC